MSGFASAARWGLPSQASLRRMTSLARAELVLLTRNRTAVFMTLLMPVLLVGASYSSLREIDQAQTGMSMSELILTGGLGTILVVVIYLNMVAVYVARREERVLKRLRTGELTDGEILAGSAIPSVALAAVQCVVLLVAGFAALDVPAPQQPQRLLLGVALGVLVMVLLAAVTAAFTRTVESAQVTAAPLLLVSIMGSGLFLPLEVLPDTIAEVCRLLPLTPAMELVRGGWAGGLDSTEALRAMAVAVAWSALAVFAVRRWFRWDPRQ